MCAPLQSLIDHSWLDFMRALALHQTCVLVGGSSRNVFALTWVYCSAIHIEESDIQVFCTSEN